MEVGAFAMMGCRCGKLDCAPATHASSPESVAKVLPPTVEPLSYRLELSLRMEEHAFDGTLEVDVEIKTAGVSSITLHSQELTYPEGAAVTMIRKGDPSPFVTAVAPSLDEAATTVTFDFGEALPVGEATLVISKFVGVLNNQMAGFYRSTYTNAAGESKLMASTQVRVRSPARCLPADPAVTPSAMSQLLPYHSIVLTPLLLVPLQFESIDARRCFPCWDEPRRKATFEVTLTVPRHMTALSNMPSRRNRDNGPEAGTATTAFMISPRMSTYLLAFVVGEFGHVAALSTNGVLVTVYTPPTKPELGEFALQCAVAALDRYDELFGHPYPLPKSDMVAIPEFAAGAMENWGLVTYREVDLLVDSASASSRQLQRVAETVIHELAHQWFGNLVTMEWCGRCAPLRCSVSCWAVLFCAGLRCTAQTAVSQRLPSLPLSPSVF